MSPVAVQMSTDMEDTKSSRSPGAIHDKAVCSSWQTLGMFSQLCRERI